MSCHAEEMAANSVNSLRNDLEPVINRWLVDYYSYQALEYFKSGQNEDFRALKRIVDDVLSRHVERTDTLPTKIKILQFLSLINEDALVESVSHLESALKVLEDLSNVCNIPHQDFQTASTSIKEMKATFMDLISQNSNACEVIEQINFQMFKKVMVTFCKNIVPFALPFLYKAADRLVGQRCGEGDDIPLEADEQMKSCCRQVLTVQYKPNQCSVIQRTRLEAAYNALVTGTDQKKFAELEEDVQAEEQDREDLCLQLSPDSLRGKDAEWDEQFQRKTGSPMEAAPADQPAQIDLVAETPAGSLSKDPPAVPPSRFPYSVAKLVVEPDSQSSSQSTAASQDPVSEVSTENPPQPLVVNNESDPQCPEQDGGPTVITRRRRRLASKATTRASPSQPALPDNSDNSSDSIGAEDIQKKSVPGRRRSRRLLPLADSEEEPPGIATPFQTPQQRPTRSVRNTPQQDKSSTDDLHISDSSLDDSSDPPHPPGPKTSSTPQKVASKNKCPSHLKWKTLYNNAVESKETWSDEESNLSAKRNRRSNMNESTISFSGHRRKLWTEHETNMLKEGVKKFGEGNWRKIKTYYTFEDRTNVQLKDRWRTLQKLNMV